MKNPHATPYITSPEHTTELLDLLSLDPEVQTIAVPGQFAQSTTITSGRIRLEASSWRLSIHHTGTAGSGGVIFECEGCALADLMEIVDELIPADETELVVNAAPEDQGVSARVAELVRRYVILNFALWDAMSVPKSPILDSAYGLPAASSKGHPYFQLKAWWAARELVHAELDRLVAIGTQPDDAAVDKLALATLHGIAPALDAAA